ncbi:MAG: hypothetical protein P1U37_14000 [Minwuia sp.]|nr:hypothetical protein [Minwuia sp.]
MRFAFDPAWRAILFLFAGFLTGNLHFLSHLAICGKGKMVIRQQVRTRAEAPDMVMNQDADMQGA